jgi:hypothetical protein
MKEYSKEGTIKGLLILVAVVVWSVAIISEERKRAEDDVKHYRQHNEQLEYKLDSLNGLIDKWKIHHTRITEYAKEWDKTHKR